MGCAAGGVIFALGSPPTDVYPFFVLGMAVLVKVQVLTALGRVDDVLAAGEEALERLADRVPQARSMILGPIAASLREAGRAEQAYDVLLRCVEVERTASRELSELHPASLATLADQGRRAAEVVRVHRAVRDRLAAALRHRRLPLVVENCEHLARPGAAVAESLLHAGPGLRIPATSRPPPAVAREGGGEKPRRRTDPTPASEPGEDAPSGEPAANADRSAATTSTRSGRSP